MPVTLKQVVDHVEAIEEFEQPGVDRRRLTGIAREVIAALGMLVDARNDEVYKPAMLKNTCRVCGDGTERGAELCAAHEKEQADAAAPKLFAHTDNWSASLARRSSRSR